MSDDADRSTVTVRGGGDSRPSGDGDELPSGTRIHRYVVERRLAGGGMGVVYRAFDPQLSRAVAIKLIRPDRAGSNADSMRLRLLREGQALARVNHPNVIAVYDVGQFGDSIFIAMELVEGRTLRDWLKEQKRTTRQILQAFRDAASALAATHKAGLVHRDFKPTNVMVGDDGRIRVLDFGLARAQLEGLGSDAETGDGARRASPSTELLSDQVTDAGQIVGTPAFMPPEQHRGDTVDGRADQFSFCASLHWALHGEMPFSGVTTEEVQRAISAGNVRTPSGDTRVPPRIRRLIVRGLAADATARFSSMSELVRELDAVLRPPRAWLIAGGSLTMVALGMLLLRLGGAPRMCRGLDAEMTSVWNPSTRAALQKTFAAVPRSSARDTFDRVSRALDEYASHWVSMRVEACEATQVRGVQSQRLLDLRMSCLDRARERVSALVSVLRDHADADVADKAVSATLELPSLAACADESALSSAVPPPQDPRIRAEVTKLESSAASAQALLDTGRFRDGLALARDLEHRAEPTHYAPLQAEAELLVGSFADANGDASAAYEALSSAAKRAAEAKDDLLAAQSWIRLVKVVGVSQAKRSEAKLIAQMAEAEVTRAGKPPLLEAQLLVEQGSTALQAGEYGEAEPLYRRAVTLAESAGAVAAARLPTFRTSLGAAIASQGRYEEARVQFERALDEAEHIYGKEHPLVGKLLMNLGLLYDRMGQPEKSLSLNQRAVAVLEKALGPQHPQLATALNNLSSNLLEAGRQEEGIAVLRRAAAIYERPGAPESPDVCYALSSLANALVQNSDFDEAMQVATRALARFEKTFGPKHPDTAFARSTLADIHYRRGHYRDAEAQLRLALEIRRQRGVDPRMAASTLVSLAETLERRGLLDEAATSIAQALAIAGGNAVVAGESSPAGADGETVAIVASALSIRSAVELDRHHTNLATSDAERALSLREKALGPRSPAVADALYRMGQARLAQGNAADAERVLTRAAEMEPGRHPDLPLILNELATAELQLGRSQQASQTITRALRLAAMVQGAPEDRARASFLLAETVAKGGDVARGKALAQEADQLYAGTESATAAAGRREVRRWLAGR